MSDVLHFKGVVAMQDTWTIDSRRVVKITHRDLPLPVMLHRDASPVDGHANSLIVGKVEYIEYDGNLVRGWGIVDNPDAVAYFSSPEWAKEPLQFEADMDQIGETTETADGLVITEARLAAVHLGFRPAWPACVVEEVRVR